MSKHQPYPHIPLYERLIELSELEDGWLDGQGRKPSKAALKAASVLGPALPVEITLYVYPTVAGGVALEWADQHGGHEIEVLPDGLLSLMTVERTTAAQPEAGTREVRIRVTAPTDENASQWAQTIADLVAAEHGQEMRLDIRVIDPSAPVISVVSPDVLDDMIAGMNGGDGR